MPTLLVHQRVVPVAQRDEVREVGRAALLPEDDVVDLTAAECRVAAVECTGWIERGEHGPLGRRRVPSGTAGVETVPARVDACDPEVRVAAPLLDLGGRYRFAIEGDDVGRESAPTRRIGIERIGMTDHQRAHWTEAARRAVLAQQDVVGDVGQEPPVRSRTGPDGPAGMLGTPASVGFAPEEQFDALVGDGVVGEGQCRHPVVATTGRDLSFVPEALVAFESGEPRDLLLDDDEPLGETVRAPECGLRDDLVGTGRHRSCETVVDASEQPTDGVEVFDRHIAGEQRVLQRW